MTCVRDPTHLDQIAALTRQVDQLSFFILYMGRDPVEAYSAIGPSATDVHGACAPTFYFPDLNFDVEALSQKDLARVDQFDDVAAFVDDTDFIY